MNLPRQKSSSVTGQPMAHTHNDIAVELVQQFLYPEEIALMHAPRYLALGSAIKINSRSAKRLIRTK